MQNFLDLIKKIKQEIVNYDTTYIDMFINISYQIYIYNETDEIAEGIILVFTNNNKERVLLSDFVADITDPVIARIIIVFSSDKLIINDTSSIARVLNFFPEDISSGFEEDFVNLITEMNEDNISDFFRKYRKFNIKK